MTGMSRRFTLLVGLLALAVAGAAPGELPEALIRRANAAFLAGDSETAESLYAAAEDRTGDPGLVAFNKGAVLFLKGEFHAAEVYYSRTLDDRACPPERAAKAWFNRGVCLVRRGGSAATYRSAIACFDRCIESKAGDAPLKANARQNLELAKLLWIEANKNATKPHSPNEPPPEEQPDPGSAPPRNGLDPGQEPGSEPGPKKEQRPIPMAVPGSTPKEGPEAAGNPIPGAVPNPQPVLDDGTPQKLSPEDSREHLRRAEVRLREERRALLRTLYGPDRPGVRDW